MDLSKLIHMIWKDKRIKESKIKKSEVKIVIHVFIDVLSKALLTHKIVKLRGLFTLDVRKMKPRRIMNRHTQKRMMTNSYYKIGIKPSKKIKDEFKKLNDDENKE